MQSLQSIFKSTGQEDLTSSQILTLVGLAGVFTFLIAVVPILNIINFPFRLLLTIVHELGHGLAAILTGGSFARFQIAANGSGLAYTAGGLRFVVIPAGYLGVALFGAVLIYLGRSYRASRIALAVLGGGMILLGLRYAAPTIFSAQILNGLLTTFASLIFGLFFLWVAARAGASLIIFLTHVVAIQAGLTAFTDLFVVVGLSTRFLQAPANDAKSMAELTFIPAIVWAVLWVVVAVILIGGSIWYTWLAPQRSHSPSSMSGSSQRDTASRR